MVAIHAVRSLTLAGFAILPLSLSELAAYVLPSDTKEPQSIRYSAMILEELGALLADSPKRTCIWFGYRLTCATLQADRARLQAADRRLRAAYGRLYNTRNNTAVESAENSYNSPFTNGVVHFAAPYPGYISHLSYDGTKRVLARDGSLRSPSLPGPGREITISPAEYGQLVRAIDDYAHSWWFSSFAELSQVADGVGVEQFWRGFAEFSRTFDFSTCGSECRGAFAFRHPEQRFRTIALCKVHVIRGTAGAPDDCTTMVAYDGDRTFLRVTSEFNGPPLGADGGTVDIECSLRGRNSATAVREIGQEFVAVFNRLSNNVTRYYVTGSGRDQYYNVIAVNRYTKSVFFDGYYENSTIRVDLYVSSDEIDVSVSTSFYVSRTEATAPERYQGTTSAETKRAIQQLAAMIPARMNCTIKNP